MGSQTYTTPGADTWTCPAGVTAVDVTCWGGGGAGGSLSTSTGAGGGGGGACAKTTGISVTPSTVYDLYVGAGGVADIFEPIDSESSYWGDGSALLAVGGAPGVNDDTTPGAGGAAASCLGAVKYSGGSGATGVKWSYGGGGGESAGAAANGNSGSGSSGGTGLADGGDGGAGRSGTQGNGTIGTVPGGGGGGALRTSSGIRLGGNGATGQVSLNWTDPPSGAVKDLLGVGIIPFVR